MGEADAALPTYRKLLDRVAAQNQKFYKRFPAGGGTRSVHTPSSPRVIVIVHVAHLKSRIFLRILNHRLYELTSLTILKVRVFQIMD